MGSSYLRNVAIATVLLCACGLSLGLKGGSTKGQEEIGPIDNYTCTDNGAFPHEEKCELFITCWNGTAILHTCTEVMLFDLVYNGCNWAEYVDCGDRERPIGYPSTINPPATTTTTDPTAPTPSTPSTTPAPNDTFVCPANGVFPHAKRCEYYWSCYEGDAQLIHCELDYLFDLKYNGCNFPDLTDCQDRERPPGSSTPATTQATQPTTQSSGGPTDPGNTGSPPTGGPGFQCPRPNGKFPDPENCEAFYTCDANIPYHEFCPPGLHFNPVLELCDWPESAGCQSRH